MKLKVLIVDDDRIELEEFKDNIDWKGIGFEVVGIAINGIVGYRQYKKLRPDVVITDVEMPGMSGIELAEKIRSDDSLTKILFLSSHEKFEYIYSGMKLEISDYLLKSGEDRKRAFDTLLKVRNEIIELRNKKSESAEKVIFSVMKGEKLDDLKTGPYTAFLRKQYSVMAIFEESVLPSVLGFIGKHVSSNKKTYNEINNVLKKNYDYPVLEIPNNGILLFVETDEKNRYDIMPKSIDLLCLELVELLSRSLDSRFYVIKLCVGKVLPEVRKLYDKNKQNFILRYFFGPDSVLDMDEILKKRKNVSAVDEEKFSQIDRMTDIESLSQFIDSLFGDVIDGLDYNSFCENMNMLSIYLVRRATETNIKDGLQFGGTFFVENVLETITTIPRAVKYVKRQFEQYYSALSRRNNYSDYVNKVIGIINRDYMDSTLNVESLAASISLSAARLRYIFKNETGETIHQYITNVRIEKAKQLLLDGKKRKFDDIAKSVGYLSGKYLSRVFKRETGMTPENYKLRRNICEK